MARTTAIGAADQKGEQVELLGGKLQLAIGLPGAPRADVEANVGGVQLGGRSAAQLRAHPRQQLPDAERLGDVVVAPGVQAGDGVQFTRLRGEEHHRHVGPGRARPAADLEPIEAGKADVQHQQVVAAFAGHPGRLEAVGRLLDLVALALQRADGQGLVDGAPPLAHRDAGTLAQRRRARTPRVLLGAGQHPPGERIP